MNSSEVTPEEKHIICTWKPPTDESVITVQILKNREPRSPGSFVANFDYALLKLEAIDEHETDRTKF